MGLRLKIYITWVFNNVRGIFRIFIYQFIIKIPNFEVSDVDVEYKNDYYRQKSNKHLNYDPKLQVGLMY